MASKAISGLCAKALFVRDDLHGDAIHQRAVKEYVDPKKVECSGLVELGRSQLQYYLPCLIICNVSLHTHSA